MEMKKFNKMKLTPEIKNLVQKELNKSLKGKVEVKSFDQGFGTTVDNVGSVLKLSSIPQGDTDSSRTGDQVEVFKLSWLVSFSNASTDNYNVYRFIIFRWMEDDSSSTPTVGAILQSVSPYSPLNRDNLRAKKFIVLHDDFVSTALNGNFVRSEKHIWEGHFKICYQATSTAGTSNVYAMHLTDSSAVPHPSMTYILRTWYHDIG